MGEGLSKKSLRPLKKPIINTGGTVRFSKPLDSPFVSVLKTL
jgi:hypothetical protein